MEDEVNRLVAASFAPATMRRYKEMWRTFRGFADVLEPGWVFPVAPPILAKFGVWLSARGYKPSTIAAHVSAVGWWHKLRGESDPAGSYLVKRVLVGLRKGGSPKKQAKPLRFPLLRKAVTALGALKGDYELKLFRAAFLVAYYASLRVGEFAVAGSGEHTLSLANTGFAREDKALSLVLILPTYKASTRAAKLLVPPGKDVSVCAVTAVMEYLKVRGGGAGPLFRFRSGAPLRGKQVIEVLRACVKEAGLDPAAFSGHSFRAGRTTDLVAMNLGDAAIRASGRWKSSAYFQYVRFDVFKLPPGAPGEE